LLSEKLIVALGKGKGTKYVISLTCELLIPINPDKYFQKEIDDREIKAEGLQKQGQPIRRLAFPGSAASLPTSEFRYEDDMAIDSYRKESEP
jgi:hypothetical protein